MATTSGRKRVTFAIAAQPKCEVAVAGSFNDWKPQELKCDSKLDGADSTFSKRVLLPRGRYEYKFLIDGCWSIDPNCPSWSPNEYGSLNSVVEVR